MANEPPPSRYPPAMGPGARPTDTAGDGQGSQSRLVQVMQARSKYDVSVDADNVSLSYELNGAPRLYRLPFDAIPLEGLSRWWLYGRPIKARKSGILAIDIIRGTENMIKRPVTQQEVEALVYWTSKRQIWADYGTLAAGALGFWVASRGHLKMKFPFVSAKPLERYNHFPLRNFSILRPQMAHGAWQLTRYTVWFQLMWFAVTPFTSTAASISVATGLANDPKTQQLVHELKEKGRSDLSKIEWPEQRQNQTHGQPPPTTQASQSGFDPDYSENGPIDRAVDDAAAFSSMDLQAREANEIPPAESYSTPEPSPRKIQSTRSSTSAESEPFFYDDASPTAGNDPDMASPQSYNQTSGGSVWDRLRRGSSPTPSPSQSQSSRAREFRSSRLAEQEAEANERDTYGTEARSRDREHAQREFDEMLERERQQSGSGEYDRGMRAVESGEDNQQSGGDSGGMSVWEKRRRG